MGNMDETPHPMQPSQSRKYGGRPLPLALYHLALLGGYNMVTNYIL